MNKKGVTLVELIIVIVIIGIISAFAVPAVGRYLENAQKSAVLRDAQEFRGAANSYCIETSCPDGTVYSFGAVDGIDTEIDITNQNLIDNFDTSKYDVMTATYDSATNSWEIDLDVTTITNASSAYEYVSATDPINATVADVQDSAE